ncbi:DUF6879 family protein [Marinitenerispora sediminis]|uniref:DUF6879 domain-containing protein n=1 Tax=Marinitenerispora sediminis TaxID=1931232 RepID=A0A368T4X0_9ACTN|nr:DUF6879 family protein [Marinitenerispora sediminis]RCV50019.1 hypothetical protein DEF28_19240 [Marinitenerispora sediminis]RCV54057.1 hypothetical protein DEF23_16530 [Marinitenerispora sediminis]RCV58564.1 hypothetical protein DEF24_13185 [Marinitenerispora sediminis]
MADRLAGSQITEFFRDGFEHTAWRLETRRAYGVASEDDDFQAWLRGEPHRPDPDRPWLRVMRDLEAAGRRVERVRILDDPPTDYQRWILEDVADSIEAGEDIRYLPRAEAWRLPHAPHEDFWLFDSKLIGVFAFEGNRSLGMALTNDLQQVLAACQIRDAAWHYARPVAELSTLAT